MAETTARVPLSFDDYQLVRDALAEARGALDVTARAAGSKVNQEQVTQIQRSISLASDRLRERAFPDEVGSTAPSLHEGTPLA